MRFVYSLLNILQRVSGVLSIVCKGVSSVALIFLVMTFAYLVYGRYILNDTPTWIEQSSILLIIFITFISAAVGLWERTHISVAIFPNRLATRYKLLCDMFINILLLLFGIVLAYYAWQLYVFYEDVEIPILEIAQSVTCIPVIISGILTSVFALTHIVSGVVRLIDGDMRYKH